MITLPNLDCRLKTLEGSVDTSGGVEFINADLPHDGSVPVTVRTSNAFIFAALVPWQTGGATGDCELVIKQPPLGQRGRITVVLHRDSSTGSGDAAFTVYIGDGVLSSPTTHVGVFEDFNDTNGRTIFVFEWNGIVWVQVSKQEAYVTGLPHLINTAVAVGPSATVALTFAASVTVTGIPRFLIKTASGYAAPTSVSGSGTATITLTYAGITAVAESGGLYVKAQYDPTHPVSIGGSRIWDFMTEFRTKIA